MNKCDLYQEIISRLVDGELSREEYAALDAHMENCAECSAMYAVFASLSEIIGSEDEALPEDLHENIMAGVRRNAMISRNRRRMSKPLRNSLAAAACAALVLFAAKGLSPAEKAQGAVLTRNETAQMDAVVEESRKEIFVESKNAAPEAPAAPVPQTEAAPAAVPTPAPTSAPTATPAPTRDIYLDPVATAVPVSSPAVTASPAPIVVHTPNFVVTPHPTQAATVAEPAAAPAAVEETEAAPAAMEEEAVMIPTAESDSAAPETAVSVSEAEALPEVTADQSPAEVAETPSPQRRLFAFFGMARPTASDSAEENPTEAGPLATEIPDEAEAAENAAAPVESPDALDEEKEDKKPLPVIKLDSLEKLTELEDMVDGTEEKLPEKKADKAYSFCLKEPEEMFKDYRIEVYIIDGGIWYVQVFSETDSISCRSECKLEDFEKFMDSLTDEEKAELLKPGTSPIPSAVPAESPAPWMAEQGETQLVKAN